MTKHTLMAFRYIIALIMSVFILSACGENNERYISSIDELPAGTKYSAWINTIGLFNDDTVKVNEYKENEDGSISITIGHFAEFKKDEMYTPGYNAVLSLISRHDEFVRNNPEYFSDNVDITIQVPNRSGSYEIVFKTYVPQYSDKLDVDHDATFKYVMFKSNNFPKILKDKAVSFDFENVILDTTYSMNDVLNVESDYYPLGSCMNYKNVIIEGHYDSSDYSLIPPMVSRYNPNAAVYYYADSNGFFTKIN